MIQFVPSRVELNPEILRLLETISRKQGMLSALRHSPEANAEIADLATVDAVHFSTKIEGNALTRDQVTAALQSIKNIKARQRDLREVLNYAHVRRLVRDWSIKNKPFNAPWVLIHHTELLKGIVRGKLSGHYREAQCVIQDSRSHEILYMAPAWKDVPILMKGLLTWIRNQLTFGTSPLLMAAQFHFEFVTIHPFMDGNGRLARLLTNGLLMAGDYDVERHAALEKQHELDRKAYYRALHALQASNYYDIQPSQNIGSWVEHWLRCLLATYDEAIGRIAQVTKEMPDNIMEGIRLKKAESLFLRHHRMRASQYADMMGLGRTQAVADLNRLLETGIIKRIGGGRSTVYQIASPHPKSHPSLAQRVLPPIKTE